MKGSDKVYSTHENAEVCGEYVVCNCLVNYIKLALPYVSPSGAQIACINCHSVLEECPLAPLSEVRGAAPRSE